MKEQKITLYIQEKPKNKKKKMEFMQRVVLTALLLPFLWVTFSYILAWFEKSNPLESLSGYVVTVPIAAIIGYITQNSVRSSTENKMKSEISKAEITAKSQEDTMLNNRKEREC